MKIALLTAAVLLVSTTARADYFACELRVKDSMEQVEVKKETAKYQVYTASARIGGYECFGKLKLEGLEISLSYLEGTSEISASANVKDTFGKVSILGATCACGLE